ncbi:hypothetical protein GCM10025751_24090 [Haladaptatus pallidirubidus]|uniref:DUF5518 domain-containing protein n=2 Tax=Haladaptatus pallidirubidus TaxID=1008152 RepID=A0AAV3UH92_9EURY
MDWKSIALGAIVQAAIAIAASIAPITAASRWASAILLLCTGLIGGFIVGKQLEETRRVRAQHGAISGVLGGTVFAIMLRDALIGSGGADGAYWGIAYLIAIVTPPSIAAQYNSILPIFLPIVGGLLFVGEAAITAASVGNETPPVYERGL